MIKVDYFKSNTGEGKTLIIAMLAVFKFLQNVKVDIVTSSTDLANQAVQEMQRFYDIFGTVVGSVKLSKPGVSCYDGDVIYGSVQDFIGDLLSHEFLKNNIRLDRQFEFIVIDEVDNMLLDGKANQVYISSDIPAMEFLEPVYAIIWAKLKLYRSFLCLYEENFYIIPPNYTTIQNGRRVFNPGFIFHKIEIASKIRYFLCNNSVSSEEISSIPEEKYPDYQIVEIYLVDWEKYLITAIKNNLRNILGDPTLKDEEKEENVDLVYIPHHLKSFVINTMLEKYIDNAISAEFHMEEKKHYIIENSIIIPVDFSNTGEISHKTQWGNGLHQFIQLKHGLKITPESLVTNYISNVNFFSRFGSNLVGVTGTLGGPDCQNFLLKTYGLDCFIIPRFKSMQYLSLKPKKIDGNEDECFQHVASTIIHHTSQGRVVLCIMEYIKDVDELEQKLLQANFNKSSIFCYRNEKENVCLKSAMKPGDVILATNIAGKGTDINLEKEVEKNGGLHVCITFLPKNIRVEEQNVGRTSRKGNRGTSELILFSHRLTNAIKNEKIFTRIFKYRAGCEKEENDMALDEVLDVKKNGAIFFEFCRILNMIDRGENNSKYSNKIMNEMNNDSKREEILELFGIWHHECYKEIRKLPLENIEDAFQKSFIQKIHDTGRSSNAYRIVIDANKYLRNGQNTQLKKFFEMAIDEDHDCLCWEAYYGYAICLLNEYHELWEERNILTDFADKVSNGIDIAVGVCTLDIFKLHNLTSKKQRGKEILVKAKTQFIYVRKIIEEKINLNIQLISSSSVANEELMVQMTNKTAIYDTILSTLDHVIGKSEDYRFESEISAIEKGKTKVQNDVNEIEQKISKTDKSNSKLVNALNERRNKMKDDLVNIDATLKKKRDDRYDTMTDERKKEQYEAQFEGTIHQAIENDADLKVELIDVKTYIKETMSKDVNFDAEIQERYANGFLDPFKTTLKNPINWTQVFFLAIIASAQLFFGALIMLSTCGVAFQIGSALFQEGLSDCFTLVFDCLINRNFSWEQYAKQKLISVATTILMSSISSLKETQGIFSRLFKQSSAVSDSLRLGLRNAFMKKVAVSAVKEVASKALELMNSEMVTAAIKSKISESLSMIIEKTFNDNDKIKEMQRRFSQSATTTWMNAIFNKIKERIMNCAKDLTHLLSTDNEAFNFIEDIFVGISKNVSKSAKFILDGINYKKIYNYFLNLTIDLTTGFASDINEVYQEIIKAEDEKIKKEKEKNDKDKKQSDSQKENKKAEKVSVKENTEQNADLKIIKQPNFDDKDNFDEIANESKSVSRHQNKTNVSNLNTQTISDYVTRELCTTFNNTILNPLTQKYTSRAIDKHLVNKIEKSNTEIFNEIHNLQRVNAISNGQSKRIERDNKFRNYNINNVKSEHVEDFTKEYDESRPLGLFEMKALAESNNIQICICDKEGRIKQTIGPQNCKKRVKVYHSENEHNGLNHFKTFDESGNLIDVIDHNAREHDCLYSVIEYHTEISRHDQTKNMTSYMKKNGEQTRNYILGRQKYLHFGGSARFPETKAERIEFKKINVDFLNALDPNLNQRLPEKGHPDEHEIMNCEKVKEICNKKKKTTHTVLEGGKEFRERTLQDVAEHPLMKWAVEELNNQSAEPRTFRIAFTIQNTLPKMLEKNYEKGEELPTAYTYNKNTNSLDKMPFDAHVSVFGHQFGEENNRDAYISYVTAYCRAKRKPPLDSYVWDPILKDSVKVKKDNQEKYHDYDYVNLIPYQSKKKG